MGILLGGLAQVWPGQELKFNILRWGRQWRRGEVVGLQLRSREQRINMLTVVSPVNTLSCHTTCCWSCYHFIVLLSPHSSPHVKQNKGKTFDQSLESFMWQPNPMLSQSTLYLIAYCMYVAVLIKMLIVNTRSLSLSWFTT